MPAHAVRVIPALATRGVYVLSILFGALYGLTVDAQERWAFGLQRSPFVQAHLTPTQANILALVLTITGALVPGIAIGLWLSCLSQRLRQTAIAAALAGAATMLSSLFLGRVLLSPDGGTDWQGWPPIGFAINLIIISFISAAAALLVRWLIRTLLFTTVEQDGTRCSRCGYQLGSPTITTCPECGVPANPTRLAFHRLHRASAFLLSNARILAGVFIVAMLIPLALAIHGRTIPSLRFFSKFTNNDSGVLGMMIPRDVGGGTSNCISAWTPIPGDTTRAIIILYVPDQRSPLPAMRLAVAETPGPSPPSGPGFQTNYGAPEIGCDLPRDLAERVVREGIPPALIRALTTEADNARWNPTPTPVGWFTANASVWIDPAPYFSAR
ncbi:MAG TPA: hypothetical protein PKE29_04430 [Phycisphaerales bacterium]|nr:hypothetical protein [Phycisphaerales bacterium]